MGSNPGYLLFYFFTLPTQEFIANDDHLGLMIIISVKFLHCKAKGFKVCGCKNSTSVKVNFFKEGPHSLIFLHCITNSIFKQFKSAVNAKSFHKKLVVKYLVVTFTFGLRKRLASCVLIMSLEKFG